MSELRFNELRGEQVAYAIHRQGRTFLPDRAHCPLDPTRPGHPPTEIPLEAFEIVVFDNRFPAFEPPAGAAEVVVYTDDHDASLRHRCLSARNHHGRHQNYERTRQNKRHCSYTCAGGPRRKMGSTSG